MGTQKAVSLRDPQQLWKQLSSHGFCLIDDAAPQVLQDALEVLPAWFMLPQDVKQQAAAVKVSSSAASAAAAATARPSGRGYFVLPAKEVLEVKEGWKPQAVQPEVRLAANAVSPTLKWQASQTCN